MDGEVVKESPFDQEMGVLRAIKQHLDSLPPLGAKRVVDYIVTDMNERLATYSKALAS